MTKLDDAEDVVEYINDEILGGGATRLSVPDLLDTLATYGLKIVPAEGLEASEAYFASLDA